VELAFAILLLLYLVLLALVRIRWTKIPVQVIKEDTDEPPGVSVIIPARNEESNIKQLVDSLNGLVYPRHKLEIVIVDDSSDDHTLLKLRQHVVEGSCIKWLALEESPFFQSSYKKRALTCGIEASKFPIIVTSDADCQFQPLWINSLVNAITSNNWIMVSAPVVYRKTGFLVSMLEIELACLVAVGAVSLQAGKPNMCNGANLAFTREAFVRVGGYQGFEHIASGDDEFLLYKMNLQFPGRIGFNKTIDSVVSTEPPVSFRELLNQRIRWGSKWKEHKSLTTKILPLLIFLFHLVFTVVFFMTLFGAYSWKVFIVQLLSKMLVEVWLLRSLFNFFGKTIKWKWFLLMQILYSFYVVLVGVVVQFYGFSWKNRRYL